MEFLVAAATNDNVSFISDHFGDAKQYHIYKISKQTIELLETLENNTPDENRHADPEKAKGIMKLLKEKKVQVVVSKQFGANIKRIKAAFVCAIVKGDDLKDGLQIVQNHLDTIYHEWLLGEERNILRL